MQKARLETTRNHVSPKSCDVQSQATFCRSLHTAQVCHGKVPQGPIRQPSACRSANAELCPAACCTTALPKSTIAATLPARQVARCHRMTQDVCTRSLHTIPNQTRKACLACFLLQLSQCDACLLPRRGARRSGSMLRNLPPEPPQIVIVMSR